MELGSMLEYIRLNPWIGVAGAFASIFSVILAILFFIKSRRIKKPVYFLGSQTVIVESDKKYPKLEIKYEGEPVSDFVVSKLLFFNRGAETIHFEDVSTADELRIEVPESVRIFDCVPVYEGEPSNLVSYNLDDNRVVFKFDYLDKNQGFIYYLYHEARSPKDMNLLGTIKGAGSPKKMISYEITEAIAMFAPLIISLYLTGFILSSFITDTLYRLLAILGGCIIVLPLTMVISYYFIVPLITRVPKTLGRHYS
jgi:hypothetical protein